ncbi:Tat pathway signal sequence domain protein [Streptomyces sp. NPDC001984]
MSGVGPVEPGEGTRAWDTHDGHGTYGAHDADGSRPHGPPRAHLAALYARHPRATLALVTTAALLAGGGYLYATRPQQPPPPPPPYPAQVVEMAYLDAESTPAGAPPRSFSFAVRMTVESGPPVTVTRVTQPYAGLALVSAPRTPFRTRAGFPREVTITMHVTDCGKVPKDAGLPFLEVTLRNTRAIQAQSFILGPRYARHLSRAVQVACSNDSL